MNTKKFIKSLQEAVERKEKKSLVEQILNEFDLKKTMKKIGDINLPISASPSSTPIQTNTPKVEPIVQPIPQQQTDSNILKTIANNTDAINMGIKVVGNFVSDNAGKIINSLKGIKEDPNKSIDQINHTVAETKPLIGMASQYINDKLKQTNQNSGKTSLSDLYNKVKNDYSQLSPEEKSNLINAGKDIISKNIETPVGISSFNKVSGSDIIGAANNIASQIPNKNVSKKINKAAGLLGNLKDLSVTFKNGKSPISLH